MSDLTVGATISHDGHTDFVVKQLIDYHPEEVAAFEKKAAEGETDDAILANHLRNFSTKALFEADEAEADVGDERGARAAALVSILPRFPKEVAIIQRRIKAGAPAHITKLKAAAAVRFENKSYCLKCFVRELVEEGAGWKLPGTIRYPKVGDSVSHDSKWDFKIYAINGRSAKFERGGRSDKTHVDVSCLIEDLVYLEEDQGWMLLGRLLSRQHRNEWKALVNSPFPPLPEKHVEARKLLRAEGLIL